MERKWKLYREKKEKEGVEKERQGKSGATTGMSDEIALFGAICLVLMKTLNFI